MVDAVLIEATFCANLRGSTPFWREEFSVDLSAFVPVELRSHTTIALNSFLLFLVVNPIDFC